MAGRRKPPPKRLFVLFSNKGEEFSHHTTSEDAHADAVGPVFRRKVRWGVKCKMKGCPGHVGEGLVCDYTVREYRLVPRSEES
jgi:hypothetical protein